MQESGQSEYVALLNWRNTPSNGNGTSPPQCFLGQWCSTKLPLCEALHAMSKVSYTDEDSQALGAQKVKQKHYYNCQTKLRSPISSGETVVLERKHGAQVLVQGWWHQRVMMYKSGKDTAAVIFFGLENHSTQIPFVILSRGGLS